jgi:hypothetical protein
MSQQHTYPTSAQLDALVQQMYGTAISYSESVREFKKRFVRLRELYPQGRFEARRFRPNIIVTVGKRRSGFCGELMGGLDC